MSAVGDREHLRIFFIWLVEIGWHRGAHFEETTTTTIGRRRGVVSAHHCAIECEPLAHLSFFFLVELLALLLLFGFEGDLALRDLLHLLLVFVFNAPNLVFEHFFGDLGGLFLFKVANSERNLATVLLLQAALQHVHLLRLALSNLVKDQVELRDLLIGKLCESARHACIVH